MDKNLASTLALLTAFLATVAATDIFLPSLPGMVTYFGVSDDAIRMSIPTYMMGGALMSPIWGVISDHLGRRPALLIGLFIFLVATLMCMFTTSLGVHLVARFIQGVGAIVVPVAGWAAIQDFYPKDKSAKVIANMGTVMILGPLVAPILGGFIDVTLGWRANFACIALLSTVALISLSINLIESKPSTTKSSISLLVSLKNYWTIVTHKKFLSYNLMLAILFSGEWCYLTLAPFYFGNTLDLLPDTFGFYIAGVGVSYFLGNMLVPRMLNWFGVDRTIMVGLGLALTASILVLLLQFYEPFPLLLCCTVGFYFAGTAFLWGPTTSRALQCFEHIRGAASAVRSLLLTLTASLGGFVGGILNYGSLFPLALYLLATSITAVILLFRIRQEGSEDV